MTFSPTPSPILVLTVSSFLNHMYPYAPPKHFFGHRIINPWNALPVHVVNAPSLDVFVSLLDTVDLTPFLPLDLATL